MASLENVLKTYNVVDEYDFTWEIHNFSQLYSEASSALFSPSSVSSIQLAMHVDFRHIKNQHGTNDSRCIFYLVNHSEVELKELRIKYRLEFDPYKSSGCFFETENEIAKFMSKSMELVVLQCPGDYLIRGNTCFFNLNSSGVLIVKCHFELSGHQIVKTSSAIPPRSDPSCNCKLSSDMRVLYASKKFCDVSIKTRVRELRAHRSILCARSSVFNTMLADNDNFIKIDDFDSEVVDCLLYYLYTGVIVDKSDEMMCDLYVAAAQFDVSALHKECREILAYNLTTETVCDIVKLAYRHNDESLEAKCVKFIADNISEISLKPAWKRAIKEYPNLSYAVEISM